MIVMPANSTGMFWHCLARETGRIGHLYSPRAQRGPWPWFPYALDNGAFSCWEMSTNCFDDLAWTQMEQAWRELLVWSQAAPIQPLWAIVPDVPGSRDRTLKRWETHASIVASCRIPVAIAVQDGMTPEDVLALDPQPEVIAVGGTTSWKWDTVPMWASEFKRVHVLRCNSPDKLWWMEDELGIESTDGTGWNRGDRKQTEGLERWARDKVDFGRQPSAGYLFPHVCRQRRDPKEQLAFA